MGRRKKKEEKYSFEFELAICVFSLRDFVIKSWNHNEQNEKHLVLEGKAWNDFHFYFEKFEQRVQPYMAQTIFYDYMVDVITRTYSHPPNKSRTREKARKRTNELAHGVSIFFND